MQPFSYERPPTIEQALSRLAQPGAMVIAGGTELVNWLKEGLEAPGRLVDISGLDGLGAIGRDAEGLHLGAIAKMSDVAQHETVVSDYPAISQALLSSASPQIRNMGTIGGNLLRLCRNSS